MDAVRIPVPYFIFGDREPFIGCIEKLMTTVNKHKLTVKRMSDLLPASFLYGIIQDKIV